MCFSASASFIASGGLAAAGIATMRLAPRPHQKLIASIPFFFAIQQAVEGWQWTALNAGSSSLIAGYIFLFFAFLFWPIYIPAIVYFLEKKKRFTLALLLVVGIGVGTFLGSLLVREPLFIRTCQHSIAYGIPVPFNDLVITLYFFTISSALIISTRHEFRWFGILLAVSALFAYYFYYVVFASVSCFFAALLSALVYYNLRQQHSARKQAKRVMI